MTILSRRAAIAAPAVLALVSACRTTSAPAPVAPADFKAFSPIMLNVAAIDVVDSRRPVAGAADGTLTDPPIEVVRRWARQRLVAGGNRGRARVVVTEASLVEVPLNTTDGVRGLFSDDQAWRWNGRVAVEITAENIGTAAGEAAIRASTKASADATATAPERSTIAEREAIMADVVKTMTERLNAALDAGIRKDLARLVTR